MSSFTKPLEVRQDADHWHTTRELRFYVGPEFDPWEWHVVPKGFQTDFASIPRLLWSLVGHPAGRYAAAAVLHDWLYATQTTSRARADWLFLEAMTVLGVRWTQRFAIYAGVRLGGWVAWASHKRRLAATA